MSVGALWCAAVSKALAGSVHPAGMSLGQSVYPSCTLFSTFISTKVNMRFFVKDDGPGHSM